MDDHLRIFRPERLASTALIAGFVAAALFSGLVVATGQPILIGLAIGTIFGVMLLRALELVVWIVLAGALLISGPVILFNPGLSKIAWLFSVLGFFLLIAAVLYPALGRKHPPGRLPRFVAVAVAFLVWSVLISFFSEGTLTEMVAGFKRYYQYWGLLFAFAVVPFAPRNVNRWCAFIVALALVQLPFAMYERMVLVPMREGVPGFTALDIVVGSFEGLMTGAGSSSVLAFFLVAMLGFVFSAYRDGLFGFGVLLVLTGIIGAPLLMGETKVVVVLLPLMLLAVFHDQVRKRPVVFIVGAVIAAAAIVGIAYVYVFMLVEPGESATADQRIDEIIKYNFGSKGYYGNSLNRFSVLPYWWEQHGWQNPVHLIFGHGIGSSYGLETRFQGQGGTLATGHIYLQHPRMAIGLTAASTLLWDLGLLGFLFFLYLLWSAWCGAIVQVNRARPGIDRTICRTLLASVTLLGVMVFYVDQMVSTPSMEVLAALTLGLIAWRSRQP